jgi:hypothetical protein
MYPQPGKMKKIILSLVIVAMAATTSFAQQAWLYSLSNVPDAIKAKADVITHVYNMNYQVEALDKARLDVHHVYTVTNKDGKGHLLFTGYSSKSYSLDDAEIRVYDANGKQISRVKKKEMTTQATGEGLIEDGYVTYYRVITSSYPVTVELNYTTKFKGTLTVPDFRYISSKESVLEANYSASVPAWVSLRYKPQQTNIQPVIGEYGGGKTYKWSVKNLPAFDYETGSATNADKYPHVKIVTDKFSHHGIQGEFTSWQSFGVWLKNLYEGLDVLPEERARFFQTLVKDATDQKEKIRRIYSYLQQNFRYVSIQLGIGGLKPFSAEFTDKKKYGDCKALSNYMKAALNTVGIRSHVAIINADFDGEPADPKFPANTFNHVILCVPGTKDSVWLECTSSTQAFGELGTSTENRYALLITEKGGALVPTPKSNASANRQETFSVVNIDDDLSGEIVTSFKTTGYFSGMMGYIYKEKRDDQKEILVDYLGFKQPDDFILVKKDSSTSPQMTLKLLVSKIPDFSAGDKLFINPRLYRLGPGTLPKYENRKLDFYFRTPYEKIDTTVFKLQAGSKPDVLPKEKELSCSYATYKAKSWYNEAENAVYSVVHLVLKKHQVPATAYNEVKAFFDSVQQNDAQKLVILKGEAQKKAF